MWQKVHNFCSDGYISLKNLCKFSLIYKHKYACLKPKTSEKWTNFKAEANWKKTWFPILKCRVGPMLNSTFCNPNTHLSEIFYVSFSESQIYSNYYHCQENIPNLSPRASTQTCKPM